MDLPDSLTATVRLQQMSKLVKTVCLHIFLSISLSSCVSEDKPKSIGDIDISGGEEKPGQVFIKPKSEKEIKDAYLNYLKNAEIDENTRLSALSRLAELELKASQKSDNDKTDAVSAADVAYDNKLNRTIELLETSLRDYPEAKSNDTLLYQLAKAYDQKGNHNNSIARLEELTQNYPKSAFYAEAQFRIAESAFSQRNYRKAEYAYTEVIISPENNIFYEKSLFKRGWSRFKQRYYIDAADDYIDAIKRHDFDEHEKLSKSELEQFNEYFRALALTFSYMGGAQDIYEYFSNKPYFSYTYYVYSMMGDIYLKQERYSDTVHIHQQFIKHYPKSENIPYSRLKIIEAWQKSGFDTKVYDAIDEFYLAYNPSSKYWTNQNENSNINRVIRRSLKKYVILISAYYHNKYQTTNSKNDFSKADLWYKRYLEYYGSYAQNDNIYFLYAELLSQRKKYKSAFDYYVKAAYQNEIIINKDAAYASITVSDKLYALHPEDKTYLDKHIAYALKYAQAYPNDKYTKKLIVHAIEIAFKSKEYKTTIELADIYLGSPNNSNNSHITSLKAASYFNLDEFSEAESIYTVLVKLESNAKKRKKLNDKLALSIYKQAEFNNKNNDISNAVKNYSRISTVSPSSEIAPTGLYDAIALTMQHKQWKTAIDLIKRFQTLYPRHKLEMDVSKKLSAAYLYSNQGIKAAREFEKLSSIGNDSEVKAAALWQAAEIYIKKGQTKDAINAYEKYVHKFKKPYPQYIEAMNKLIDLNKEINSMSGVNKWYKNILKADRRALNNAKTERTKFVVSTVALKLANSEMDRFNQSKLTLPLKKSLKRKKSAMQNAVKLYAKASKYKVFEIVTESTHKIASIYKSFSKSLMNSERPTNLNEEELNQYEILLEDQAFPFEDKAIEFYEINLSRIKDGYYNDWIKQSHAKLIELFPTRYKREPKQDAYVNVIN
jgi:cellulose synthase operon protein C